MHSGLTLWRASHRHQQQHGQEEEYRVLLKSSSKNKGPRLRWHDEEDFLQSNHSTIDYVMALVIGGDSLPNLGVSQVAFFPSS
mmetsp:Transcript_26478/g.64512  ORF Transcript_26478/g.64512 Transcript_26478/m.64512 type:complete len:83 (+) Transcript_26478:758-1006(+)